MSVDGQRNLWFITNSNPDPAKSQSPPVPKRRMGSEDWKGLRMQFDDPNLTGAAGMPLMFLHERNLKIKDHLARSIKLGRRSDAFGPSECSKFLIDSKLQGLTRISHVGEIRKDPVYCKEYGLSELPCGKTVGKYLKSFEQNHLESLRRLNNKFADRVIRRSARRAEEAAGQISGEGDPTTEKIQAMERDRKGRLQVGLDFDSSCMAVYGKQEGSDRGRHPRKKDSPGFQPKFAFLSGLDVMVHQRLYPESQGLSSGFTDFYQESKELISDRLAPKYVRGDCALYSKENVKMFEADGLTFGITAQKTSHMWEAIDRLEESDWIEFEGEDGDTVELAELYYKPATWPGSPRVFVLSRRLSESKYARLFGLLFTFTDRSN